jgi:hypothetical protein
MDNAHSNEKAREDRCRREARRQGYKIAKSRVRPQNQHVRDQGGYMILNDDHVIEAGETYGLTLEDVETWLRS